MPAQLIVSILMPCFNAAETLEEALESLSNQSLSGFEIIAVNDGSTDQTLEILKAYQARDGRLRLVDQTHGGIVNALNAGLAACQAGYIARMDSDDRCHPERLIRQVRYLDAHPETGVVSCRVVGYPQKSVRRGFEIYIEWLNSLLSDAEIRREIFVESPLPHPSVIFRKEVVQAVGGYQDHGWAEDYDLWLRLYMKDVHFARLPEVLVEWRDHPGRLTLTDPRYSLENFIRAKAFYLARGPLSDRDAVIIWGAGMMGRRLSKHLARQGAPLVAFVDIDTKKIGCIRRGLPVIAPQELTDCWSKYQRPVLLAAVGARGARKLIQPQLLAFDLEEGRDWWSVA